MDSVILAHEVIHSLKTTKTPGILIRLDLSKSFDIISWQYMHSLLEAFGFDNHWVNWIMRLTSLAFFYILVNGVPSQPFSPTKGIHQGDPLSPFLFVLMKKGLGCYLKAKPCSWRVPSKASHYTTFNLLPCIAILLMKPSS
jgi:hypothetical protein